MTVYANARLRPRITPMASGAVYIDRQKTDLSTAPALSNGDSLQIGIVPAGCKLLPRKCSLWLPQLDTNGAATGKYKIGTALTTDSLVAESSASAAVDDEQPNFKDIEIGSPDVDTPLYITLSAALATQANAGFIVFDVAMRAYDSGVDG